MSKLSPGETVSERDVLEVSGFIEPSVIENWLKACLSGSFEQIQNIVQQIISDGYAAGQLLNQLHDTLIDNEHLDDPKKARIFEKLSIADKRLMDGASEYLQLMDVSCEIMKAEANLLN